MASAAVQIEVTGPGVEPETVDARALLDLASAILDIVAKLAADRSIDLRIVGLEVLNKCAALSSRLEPKTEAKALLRDALTIVEGGADGRRGYDDLVRRARRAVDGLAPGHEANVIVGRWKARVEAPKKVPGTGFRANTTLVAVPERVGGPNRKIAFSSFAERDPFTLEATAEQCRQLGAELYREVEVTFDYRRNETGAIGEGQLNSFRRLDVGKGTLLELQTWLKAAAPDLLGASDVVAALGRRPSTRRARE